MISEQVVGYGLFILLIAWLVIDFVMVVTRERGRRHAPPIQQPPQVMPEETTHCPECGWPRGVHTGACSRGPFKI